MKRSKIKKIFLYSSMLLPFFPIGLAISCSNGDPEKPIDYQITFINQETNYEINKNYEISANVDPEGNYNYHWWTSDSNLKLINETSQTVSFSSTEVGQYLLNVDILDQNNVILASKAITINFISKPTYTLSVFPKETYDVNKTYELSVSVTPDDSTYQYQWITNNSNDIKLLSPNSKTLQFVAYAPGQYEFSVSLLNQSGDILAQKNQIIINVIEILDYSISFQNVNSFNFGDYSKLASDSSINGSWIKDKVIDNREFIFNIPSTLLANFDWNSNLSITNIQPDDAKQSLSFNLTLDKADPDGLAISSLIIFTGFRDPSSSSTGDYVITFKSQTSFPYGDPNQSPSQAGWAYVRNKIINNKEQFFNIPSNVPSNFDWERNVRIENATWDNDQGTYSFTIYLQANDSQNPYSGIRSSTITFTGYKKGQPYNININPGPYSYGDTSKLASDNSINEQWIKQVVLDQKDNIFDYRRTPPPDNFDWEQNVEITNLKKDDTNRSVTFNLILNNANNDGISINSEITFNDFKELPWTTTSMPSDVELRINNIKKPYGITGVVQSSQALSKLNEYGIVRSFALINKILLDVLFVNQGFINTSIEMTNNNFNEIIFVLSGEATKDFTDWGKRQIPISSIIENWSGATIQSGQRVELTIKYARNSTSSLRGQDVFDGSFISFTPNVWGTDTLNWNGIDVDFRMFSREFTSWGSIKVNSNIIKQSSSSDNRTFLLFVNHENGINYLIQSSSIVNNYYRKEQD